MSSILSVYMLEATNTTTGAATDIYTNLTSTLSQTAGTIQGLGGGGTLVAVVTPMDRAQVRIPLCTQCGMEMLSSRQKLRYVTKAASSIQLYTARTTGTTTSINSKCDSTTYNTFMLKIHSPLYTTLILSIHNATHLSSS